MKPGQAPAVWAFGSCAPLPFYWFEGLIMMRNHLFLSQLFVLSSTHVREPDSGKLLFVESRMCEIFACGIRNTAQVIRNPTNDGSLESKFHSQKTKIHYWNPESRIQDCVEFSYMGRMSP